MSTIKKACRFIKAFVLWLFDAWRFGATLLIVLIITIIGLWLTGIKDDGVRYCGLSLQLLGIFTVVLDLHNRRRLFNSPSLIDEVRRWLGRHPRWGAKPQTTSFSGTIAGSPSGSLKLSNWRVVPTEASIEDRLVALQANVEILKTEQAETIKELQEETTKRIEAVDSERRRLESTIIDIQTQLGILGVGSLHLEWAGVFLLILGVILAAIPSEIAVALKWLLCKLIIQC